MTIASSHTRQDSSNLPRSSICNLSKNLVRLSECYARMRTHFPFSENPFIWEAAHRTPYMFK